MECCSGPGGGLMALGKLKLLVTGNKSLAPECLHMMEEVELKLLDGLKYSRGLESDIENLREELHSRSVQMERLSFDAQEAIDDCKLQAESLCQEMISKVTSEFRNRKDTEKLLYKLKDQNERLKKSQSNPDVSSEGMGIGAGADAMGLLLDVDDGNGSGSGSGRLFDLKDGSTFDCLKGGGGGSGGVAVDPQEELQELHHVITLQEEQLQRLKEENDSIRMQRDVEMIAVGDVIRNYNVRMIDVYKRCKDFALLHRNSVQENKELHKEIAQLRLAAVVTNTTATTTTTSAPVSAAATTASDSVQNVKIQDQEDPLLDRDLDQDQDRDRDVPPIPPPGHE